MYTLQPLYHHPCGNIFNRTIRLYTHHSLYTTSPCGIHISVSHFLSHPPPLVNFDILTPLKWDLSSINILQNLARKPCGSSPTINTPFGVLFIVEYLCLVVGIIWDLMIAMHCTVVSLPNRGIVSLF